MSRIIATIVSLLAVAVCVGGFAQSKAKTRVPGVQNCATAKTQLELNECATAEEQKAEEEMNQLYRQLLSGASKNPAYREKLEAAQKAWLAYRDAELEAKYPAQDKRGEYGSVYPMCFANDRTDLVRQRIEEIKALLKQTEDVCAGEWPRHQTE
jgi:uncharacterized protein YecT (DUF1311 family)